MIESKEEREMKEGVGLCKMSAKRHRIKDQTGGVLEKKGEVKKWGKEAHRGATTPEKLKLKRNNGWD